MNKNIFFKKLIAFSIMILIERKILNDFGEHIQKKNTFLKEKKKSPLALLKV